MVPDGRGAGSGWNTRVEAILTNTSARVSASPWPRATPDAQGIEWGGPAVGGPVQLADPLIGPPGHDGLSGRVLGRRVVEAPLRTALGVAPVPGRSVDGEHQGPRLRSVLD